MCSLSQKASLTKKEKREKNYDFSVKLFSLCLSIEYERHPIKMSFPTLTEYDPSRRKKERLSLSLYLK